LWNTERLLQKKIYNKYYTIYLYVYFRMMRKLSSFVTWKTGLMKQQLRKLTNSKMENCFKSLKNCRNRFWFCLFVNFTHPNYAWKFQVLWIPFRISRNFCFWILTFKINKISKKFSNNIPLRAYSYLLR